MFWRGIDFRGERPNIEDSLRTLASNSSQKETLYAKTFSLAVVPYKQIYSLAIQRYYVNFDLEKSLKSNF